MRKKLTYLTVTAALGALITCALPACNRQPDYTSYISEKRTNIYMYDDDNISLKIHCGAREQPYNADGYLGEMCPVTEIYVTLPKTYDKVEVSVNGNEGEMNYSAQEGRYYLSFTAEEFTAESVDVTVTYGENSQTYKALGARYAGVMSCEDAVKCVIDYDKELFSSLTSGRLFDGEIYVRLLFDDGCYYYVGVCDKQKNITAYLLDGERGKVITTKKIQG